MGVFKIVLIVVLWLFAMAVCYIWGAMSTIRVRGKILIEETDDPEYYGKVTINFDDEIEKIAKHKYVTLCIEDTISKKYSFHNEDQK